MVAARTEKLKFLVAMRPGFVSPTVAAKMSNTFDQLTQGRVLINVVTGGFPAELAADGDFTDHDERYERTQEFMQVVRKAWTEPKTWDHEGTYYKVENGNVLPEAVPAAVPAVLLRRRVRRGEEGRRRGDGRLPALGRDRSPMVRERIADMRQRAAALGRTLRFGMRIHVVVRETEEEARAAAEALVAGDPGELPEHDGEAP